ncbi:hypothetical protein DAMA08_035240 [Martiniozyma asiatica (nom. inval.)]|nr:hypothetical protein DAMA08_035240 [Martiniozyma asiatica]
MALSYSFNKRDVFDNKAIPIPTAKLSESDNSNQSQRVNIQKLEPNDPLFESKYISKEQGNLVPSLKLSPSDIFERSIGINDSELSLGTNENNSACQNLSNRPHHLLSENFTSPVLDSTVEMLAANNLDDIDMVEVPHRSPSFNIWKTCSKCPSSQDSLSSSPRMSISRKYSNTNCKNQDLNNGCLCGREINLTKQSNINSNFHFNSPRKSISYFSYSDLVNFERMSQTKNNSMNNNNNNNSNSSSNSNLTVFNNNDNNNNNTNNETNNGNTNNNNTDSYDDNILQEQLLSNEIEDNTPTVFCPRHGLARRATVQGCPEDKGEKIDEQLEDDNYEELAILEDESVHSWTPQPNVDLIRPRSRGKSVVEELASLTATTSNNSFFEDELDVYATDSGTNGEPLVHVCSAKDLLNSKSRKLRESFVESERPPVFKRLTTII